MTEILLLQEPKRGNIIHNITEERTAAPPSASQADSDSSGSKAYRTAATTYYQGPTRTLHCIWNKYWQRYMLQQRIHGMRTQAKQRGQRLPHTWIAKALRRLLDSINTSGYRRRSNRRRTKESYRLGINFNCIVEIGVVIVVWLQKLEIMAVILVGVGWFSSWELAIKIGALSILRNNQRVLAI